MDQNALLSALMGGNQRQMMLNPSLTGLPTGGITAPRPGSMGPAISPLMAPPPQFNQGSPHIAPPPPVTPPQQQQDPMGGFGGIASALMGPQGGNGQGGLLGKLFPSSVPGPQMSPGMPMPLPTMGQAPAPSMTTAGGATITGAPIQMPTDIQTMQPNLKDISLLGRLGSLFGR